MKQTPKQTSKMKDIPKDQVDQLMSSYCKTLGLDENEAKKNPKLLWTSMFSKQAINPIDFFEDVYKEVCPKYIKPEYMISKILHEYSPQGLSGYIQELGSYIATEMYETNTLNVSQNVMTDLGPVNFSLTLVREN